MRALSILVQSLEQASRRVLPLLTVMAAILLDLLPLTTLAADAVRPSLTIVAVYFWTLYRPDLMGPLGLFVLGLIADAIAGIPLGTSSLMLLAIRFMVMVPQRILLARSFLGGWFGLALVTFSLLGLRWLLACLYALHLFPLGTVLVSSLLTVACYPPLALILGRVRIETDEPQHAAGN